MTETDPTGHGDDPAGPVPRAHAVRAALGAAPPPETGRRLGYRAELDGLRAVAVGLVMLPHHVPGVSRGAGVVGVGSFFALSGFLITSLLWEEFADSGRISFRGFYRRRFLRLLPALSVAIAVFVLFSLATIGFARTWKPALAAGLYVTNWAQIAGMSGNRIGHTWTLAIEEHFYLLWPALFLIMIRRWSTRRVAVTTLIIALGFGLLRVSLWAASVADNHLARGTETRLDGILLGCVVALFWGRRLPAISHWVGAGALLALASMTFFGATSTVMVTVGYTLLPIAALTFILYVLGRDSVPAQLLRHPWLVAVGRMSYGLYLYHPIVYGLVLELGLPIQASRALSVATSFAVASISYRFIEMPFLKRKRPGTDASAQPPIARGQRPAQDQSLRSDPER